jgi:hypothetical protein
VQLAEQSITLGSVVSQALSLGIWAIADEDFLLSGAHLDALEKYDVWIMRCHCHAMKLAYLTSLS